MRQKWSVYKDKTTISTESSFLIVSGAIVFGFVSLGAVSPTFIGAGVGGIVVGGLIGMATGFATILYGSINSKHKTAERIYNSINIAGKTLDFLMGKGPEAPAATHQEQDRLGTTEMITSSANPAQRTNTNTPGNSGQGVSGNGGPPESRDRSV